MNLGMLVWNVIYKIWLLNCGLISIKVKNNFMQKYVVTKCLKTFNCHSKGLGVPFKLKLFKSCTNILRHFAFTH